MLVLPSELDLIRPLEVKAHFKCCVFQPRVANEHLPTSYLQVGNSSSFIFTAGGERPPCRERRGGVYGLKCFSDCATAGWRGL